MRVIALPATGLLVAALVAGCGGGTPASNVPGPSAAGLSSTSSAPASTPTPAPSPSTLSKVQAAARYRALADAYAKSRQDLDRALDADNPNLKAIRAGAKLATAGYKARVAGLINTLWPKDVQPYIDKYVDLSGYGLDTLNAAAHAKTISELLDSGAEADTRKLNAADAVVRTKLGLPLRSS